MDDPRRQDHAVLPSGIWLRATAWRPVRSRSGRGLGVAIPRAAATASYHLREEWVNLRIGIRLIPSPWARHDAAKPSFVWNALICGTLPAVPGSLLRDANRPGAAEEKTGSDRTGQ